VKIRHDSGDAREKQRLEGEETDARQQHALHDQEQLHHQHQRGQEGDQLRGNIGGDGGVHGKLLLAFAAG